MPDTGDQLKIPRRSLLLGGSAFLSGIALPGPAPAMTSDPSTSLSNAFLLLEGIGNDIEPDFLEDILSVFFRVGIPICCVIDPVALMIPGEADNPLLRRIAEIGLREPGLFEVVLQAHPPDDPHRYFQMRTAATLRAAVAAAFTAGPAADHPFPVVSLYDRSAASWLDLPAFRAAGFRVLMRPAKAETSGIAFVGRGQMSVSGSLTLKLSDAAAKDAAAPLAHALATSTGPLIILSLDGIGSQAPDATLQYAARLADTIRSAMDIGAIRITRPMDHLLQAGPALPLEVALLIESGGNAAEAAAVAAFAAELGTDLIPFTLGGETAPEMIAAGAAETCAAEWPPANLPSAEAAPRSVPTCVQGTGADAGEIAQAVPIVVTNGRTGWTGHGINADGRLVLSSGHAPNEAASAFLAETPLVDQVVRIKAQDILTPAQRTVLILQILTASQERRVRFHTITDLAAYLLAPEPVLTRLWSARKRMVTDPPRLRAVSETDAELLRADARLAWTFIDRFTDPQTGLCAGTVRGGADPRVNREATMWDLASQLQGIIAARGLGIIPEAEAIERAATLLDHLPIATVEGLRLPPAMFTTDTRSIVTTGFDICDSGRFLIALRAAVEAGIVAQDRAARTVARWDIADTLLDGRAHNYTAQHWVDFTMSHCASYLRKGLADWGFSSISPYRAPTGGSEADRRIGTLYDAAAIGHFGTEPLLLEAVETGFSPEAAFLTEVLFDAQISWFEETGELKCASEGPLNFEPWFAFQGLRVDRLGEEAWVVSGNGGDPEYQTQEFRDRAELLNTKSAYLWAAVRPHPYCDRLVALMRERARIDGLGFSVGIFTKTLAPMQNYSDLNTNGIVLTAIAHTVNHRPAP